MKISALNDSQPENKITFMNWFSPSKKIDLKASDMLLPPSHFVNSETAWIASFLEVEMSTICCKKVEKVQISKAVLDSIRLHKSKIEHRSLKKKKLLLQLFFFVANLMALMT